MKLILAGIIMAAMLACSAAKAETVTATTANPITSGTWITLETNSATAFLSGPLVDLFGNLSSATNWGAAVFGIESGGSYGAGAVLLYNVTKVVATGVGLDYIAKGGEKQVTMPSAQIQFQTEITLASKVTLRPFAFTGVATPISGKGPDNGSVVGIFGAGTGVKIYGNLSAFYAIEERTGESNPWNLFGLSYLF